MPIDYVFNGTPHGGVSGPAIALNEADGSLHYATPNSGGWQPVAGGSGGGSDFTTPVTIAPATTGIALTVNGDADGSLVLEVLDNNGTDLFYIESDGTVNFQQGVNFNGAGSIRFLSGIETTSIKATGNDFAGEVQLLATTTTVSVVYSAAFLGVSHPVVLVTPEGSDTNALGGYWVTHNGSTGDWTGFTIHVHTADAVNPHNFDWAAIQLQ